MTCSSFDIWYFWMSKEYHSKWSTREVIHDFIISSLCHFVVRWVYSMWKFSAIHPVLVSNRDAERGKFNFKITLYRPKTTLTGPATLAVFINHFSLKAGFPADWKDVFAKQCLVVASFLWSKTIVHLEKVISRTEHTDREDEILVLGARVTAFERSVSAWCFLAQHMSWPP